MAGPVYRIHPAIGIARVGNADANTFFIGPELPGLGPTGDSTVGSKVPDFKVGGLLKPQAARFRVWEYVEKRGKLEPSREITLDVKDCAYIAWRVHVANRKASFFEFNYLQGESTGTPPPRRNAGVTNRRTLDIDPLARQIGGRNVSGPRYEFRKGMSSNSTSELWPNPAPVDPIEYLGELRTDPVGRLIFIGGKGRARGLPGKTLGDAFNNDGWFDDVSDGRVTVELGMKVNGQLKVYGQDQVEGAWVICGPPDFAPSIESQVTLYDVLYDMAATLMKLPTNEAIYDTVLKPLVELNAELLRSSTLSKYEPSFDDEIYPILNRAFGASFTFQPSPAKAFHSTFQFTPQTLPAFGDRNMAQGKVLRDVVFKLLHKPGVPGNPPAANMPLMHGDAFDDPTHPRMMLTLTETQYAIMKRWADGHFKSTAGTLPPARPAWMTTVSPHGLDRAALENCVGGAFATGIEVSWQIRNRKLYRAPFRINHRAETQYLGDIGTIQPGHFTRQMALPWQTDFFGCTFQKGLAWWPAQRPDVVYLTKKDYETRPGTSHVWTRASTSWASGVNGPSMEEFVQHYYKLGIVREDPPGFHLEKERNDPNVP